MLLAQWPVSVVMQRRTVGQRFRQVHWRAHAVLPAGYAYAESVDLRAEPDALQLLVPGLMLELHRDELDGYFENWVAPEPKVFVAWQLHDTQKGQRALPFQVSVSYAEGARMLDSGDGADGVDMPPAVHDWLGACLAQHRPPRPHRGHGRHHHA